MAAPATPPEYDFGWGPSQPSRAGSPPRNQAGLSPPLIAMVAVVGAAFLVVFYVRLLSRYCRRWRRWRRRRRLALSTDLESTGPGGGGLDYYSSGASSNYFLSPYGLDDSTIKTLPLSVYSKAKAAKLLYWDCAVCLLEFEDNDSLRTLPLCSHAFHVDCIDIWLRSHANCPLCRAGVFRQDSPFIPMRAARIRPSLDDFLIDPLLPPPPPPPPESDHVQSEITLEAASPAMSREDDRIGGGGRDFLLKRSYSFGFERNLAADRMVLEASTASPWRYRHRSFWSKRWPSPFSGVGAGGSSSSRAARVFSFRSYRGVAAVKSPFFRRRGFFPLSESSIRFSGAGPSSRRTRSLTSPVAMFSRPSGAAAGSMSSRLRCGDPEALLSPERLNHRR